MEEILRGLNPNQKEAVTHGSGPLLIIAGAGTGKTMVITRRIAWLIAEKLAKPSEILALTFTDKAANEMESRVDLLVPYGYIDVSILTFHAFGDRVLRDHAIDLGLRPDYRVLSLPEQIIFFREHLFEFPLRYYKSLGDPTKHIEALIEVISRAKDEDVGPEEYLSWSQKALRALRGKKIIKTEKAERWEWLERHLEVAKVYKKYQELKMQKGFVDFGDQVNLTLKLFREHPSILKKFQQRYKFILVDEFQDTNYAQFELLKLLAGKQANLTVVGDDDQCLPSNAEVETINGKRKISEIKVGDQVLTAVGRGCLSYSRVNKVMRKSKYCRLITFKTESGKKITVTSNHKMFCYVPTHLLAKDKNTYYVYLMHRSDLGWRLGVTNDLATRVKLERSADRIIGLRSFSSEDEARYYEVLWSLKYGVPTVCFQKRRGVVIKEEWLKKLYQEIDTDIKVRRLAYDLDIDLNAHHYCLTAVKRGNKTRVKINLEMCYRKYKAKPESGQILKKPLITHVLSLETSDERIREILEEFGFPYKKTKKGIRVRVNDQDLEKIGELAEKLRVLTGGILEVKFQVGILNKQSKPALVLPASNILIGHYLPIVNGNKVIYEKVVDIISEYRKEIVYDLEVDRTHNFVADGTVVHNSIYKFRGAAISNILNFEKTYPKCKKVVLTKNYRSTQAILDSARRLIKHNDPERLEVRAGVDKRLVSAFNNVGKRVEHYHFDKVTSEADWVAQTIKEKHERDGYQLKDFAILVRSNADAEPFRQSLNMLGIPHQFSGGGGLYVYPEIRLVVSFLRVIGDLADSVSLYNLSLSEIYQLDPLDLQKMNTFASRRNYTLHHVFSHLEESRDLNSEFGVLNDLKDESRATVKKIMQDIQYYLQIAKQKSTGEVLLEFLKRSGYLSKLTKEPSLENENRIKNLSNFFEKIREFKEVSEVDCVSEFVKYLNILKEAGDDPESAQPDIDVDAVNILTVHKAKGLEFPVVFLVSLVDEKFPVRRRRHPIELPEELIKEEVPAGDYHLMEERRLFYVGMTRAKKELYLTSSVDYGGKRERKVSQFVLEALDLPKANISIIKKPALAQIELFASINPPVVPEKSWGKEDIIPLSYYQIDDYLTCPLKYKYVHILRVPLLPNHQIIYGSALHKAVQTYFLAKKDKRGFTEKQLLEVFAHNWSSEGFISRQHEEQRFAAGKEALKKFFKEEKKRKRIPLFVEEEFTILEDKIQIKGRFDLVEQSNIKGQEPKTIIVDFKSSEVKTKEEADRRVRESLQLKIYALAWQRKYGKLPDLLELYFLETGLVGSICPKMELIEETLEKIKMVAEGIRSADYHPKPNPIICNYCSYREACPSSAV